MTRDVDRSEIETALLRYARGVDRCDWELVRSAYHPDAIDDHGEYKGDLNGFIAYLSRRHQQIEQSQHLITNVFVEFYDDDGAVVESHFAVQQRVLADAEHVWRPLATGTVVDAPAYQLEVWGRYVDRFQRRQNRWAIQERTVILEVYKLEPTISSTAEGWGRWQRNGEDPLEELRRAVGLLQGQR